MEAHRRNNYPRNRKIVMRLLFIHILDVQEQTDRYSIGAQIPLADYRYWKRSWKMNILHDNKDRKCAKME